MTIVVLASSITVAREHGAVATRNWRGAWTATAPCLGWIHTLPCGSEEEALSECGDLIRLQRARQGSATS